MVVEEPVLRGVAVGRRIPRFERTTAHDAEIAEGGRCKTIKRRRERMVPKRILTFSTQEG